MSSHGWPVTIEQAAVKYEQHKEVDPEAGADSSGRHHETRRLTANDSIHRVDRYTKVRREHINDHRQG